MTAPGLPEAVAHLREYLDGLDVAVDCERRIEAAYASELADAEIRYEPGIPSRKVRVALEAMANARRTSKDAEALRTVLATFD